VDEAPPAAGDSQQPILETDGVSKHYGPVTALENFSVSLYRGEVCALVGDNGAGKSTFVSILSGVIQPDAGTIRIAGEPVRIDNPHSAQLLGIATVFQDLALVNQRDVACNLFLGREPRRFRIIADRRRMVRESAALISSLKVGLPSVRTRTADLSGGQRQAVAVARTLIGGGGRITLMDEPTAALGVREAGRVLDLIVRLREEGQAVLFVSHNMENVFGLADRIVVLRHGRRIAERRTSETTRDEIVGLLVGAREAPV
jgi:ABC-type sugar transport system ATPase subunit